MDYTRRRPPEANGLPKFSASLVLPVDLVHLALDAGFSTTEVAWLLDLRTDRTDAPFHPVPVAA